MKPEVVLFYQSVYNEKFSDGPEAHKEYDLEKFIEDVYHDKIPYFSRAEMGILPVIVFNLSNIIA